MRHEWNESRSKSGYPTLRQWPETELERSLTSVERAVLEATLTKLSERDPAIAQQIERANCSYRDMTGYGIIIELAIPTDCPLTAIRGSGVGGAVLAWNGRERYLVSIAFFQDGKLDFLDLTPVDAQPWSVDECLAIMNAPVESVEITPQGW